MDIPAYFEWDEVKAKKNLEEGRPSFEAGMEVFFDSDLLMAFDAKHSAQENRFNVIGVVDGVCLHVTFTWREPGVRLISVRCASRQERSSYGRSQEPGGG